MKFGIRKELILKALDFAYMPVLVGHENVMSSNTATSLFIEAKKDCVSFYGTNLDTLHTYTIQSEEGDCKVYETGKMSISVKNFLGILKKYKGDDIVEFELKKKSVMLSFEEFEEELEGELESFTCEIRYRKSIQKIDASGSSKFPLNKLIIKEESESFELPLREFYDSFEKVWFACGNLIDRPILKNICIEWEDSDIYFVASSGFDVAIYKTELSSDFSHIPSQILINKNVLLTEKKYLNPEHPLIIRYGVNIKGKKLFAIEHSPSHLEKFQIFVKLPVLDENNETEYPNWRRFLEGNSQKVAVFNRKDSIETLARVISVAPKIFLLSILDDEIRFSGITADGSSLSLQESLSLEESHKNIMLSLNPDMFRNGLRFVNSKAVNLNVMEIGGNRMIHISADDDPGYNYYQCLVEEVDDEEEDDESI